MGDEMKLLRKDMDKLAIVCSNLLDSLDRQSEINEMIFARLKSVEGEFEGE